MISIQKTLTRIIICMAIATISFVQTVKAQSNIQDRTWGEWYQLSNCLPQPCGAAVAFLPGDIKNHNGLTWKFRNDRIIEGGYIKFKFDHRKYDGTVATDEVTLYLDRTGEWKSSGDLETSNSYELASQPYSIIPFDPNKDKARQIKNDVNDGIKNYNQQYNDAITAANNVKDPTKHNQFIEQINANKEAFHQLDIQAQNQMNAENSNALIQTLNQMKQQQGSLKTIYLQIDPDEPPTTSTKNNTETTTNNTLVITAPQTNTITNTNTQQQAIRQEIIQGQQQMQQQTNEKIQNSLQQGADAVTNYANFLANESVKKEEGQFLHDERILKVNQLNSENARLREEETLKDLNAAVVQGDIKAMRELGDIYSKGNNVVSKDIKQAEYWYKRAAEQGDVTSQAFLCKLYYYFGGKDLIDQDKAICWCEKAVLKEYIADKEYDAPRYLLSKLYTIKARKYFGNNDFDQAAAFYQKGFALKEKVYDNQDAKNIVHLVLKNKLILQDIIDVTQYNLSFLQEFYFSLASSYQYGEAAIVNNQQAILYYQKMIDLKDIKPEYKWLKKGEKVELAKKRIKELKKLK